MQFIHPSILWALGALAIPIIIHLFHFRRFKRVYFSNVHLLKEIKEETSTRSKLRNLLILLARCTAIAMLVFAFAQPIMKSGSVDDARDRAIILIIDNSFSMDAQVNEVPLLVLARDKALEIVNSYQESDRYLVLTHDLEAKHQRFVDQETAEGFISEIQITPNVESLEGIGNVALRLSTGLDDYNRHIYFLSDFQENISSFEQEIDSSYQKNLIPFRAIQESNIGIESAEWLAPIAMKDQLNQLVVKLHNYSDEMQSVELRMDYEDQERPLGSIQLSPHSDVYDTINVTVNRTGWHDLTVTIDDYPIEFDNSLVTTFNIKDRVDVMSIYEGSQSVFLANAFESIEYYTLNQVQKNTIRYEILPQQELIILNDLGDISSGLSSELIKYVRNGGNLLIFPSRVANLQSYNDFFSKMSIDRLVALEETEKKDVGRINTQEFIFKDVYESTRGNIRLPATARNYTLSSVQASGKEWLLRYRDGSPYLQKFNLDKGTIFLCTSPLDPNSNDLVSNAEVFVPMLYKMALSSGSKARLFYTIGVDDVIALDQMSDLLGERYTIDGPAQFIPALTPSQKTIYMDIRGQISEEGVYQLMQENEEVSRFAFNYDRKESDVVYSDMNTILDNIGPNTEMLSDVALADLSTYISEKNEGIHLWRWCLMGALLFLLIETALIRLWK